MRQRQALLFGKQVLCRHEPGFFPRNYRATTDTGSKRRNPARTAVSTGFRGTASPAQMKLSCKRYFVFFKDSFMDNPEHKNKDAALEGCR
jgi:hypothetical protein